MTLHKLFDKLFSMTKRAPASVDGNRLVKADDPVCEPDEVTATLDLLRESAVLMCSGYGQFGIPVVVVIGSHQGEQLIVAPQDSATAAKMLYRAADEVVNRMPTPSQTKN